jgi:hypothetical protein
MHSAVVPQLFVAEKLIENSSALFEELKLKSFGENVDPVAPLPPKLTN